MSTDESRPSLVIFQANSNEIRGWIWTKVDPSVTTVQWQRLPSVSNQGLTNDWGDVSDAYYDDKTGGIFFLLKHEQDRLVIVSADDLTMSSTLSILDTDPTYSRGSGIVRCGSSLLAFGWQAQFWNLLIPPFTTQQHLYSCRTDTSGGAVLNGSTWTECIVNIPPPNRPHPMNGRLLGDTRFPGLKHAFYFSDEHYFHMIKSQDFHQLPADQNATIAWKRVGIVNGSVSPTSQDDHPLYTSFITSYQPGGTGPIKYRLYVFGCTTFDQRLQLSQQTAYGTCISLDETGQVEGLITSNDGSPDYVKLPVENESGFVALPGSVDPQAWCKMRATEYGSGGSWAIALQTQTCFRLFTIDVQPTTGYLINAQAHECRVDNPMMDYNNHRISFTMAAIPTPRQYKALGASEVPDDEGDFDENDGE